MNEFVGIADQDIIASLAPMFLDDTRQRIEEMEGLLERMREHGKTGEPYLQFMRTVHSIKGIAHTFGFPTVAIIAHKLEDYMHFIPAVGGREMEQILIHVDAILRILDAGENPGAGEEETLLRRLPSPIDTSDFAIDHKVVQTLFIGPKNVQFAMFELELKSCGFNVTNSASSFHAMDIAVRMRPDLILVCNVIDHVNGIEVAHALKAFNATRTAPQIFVTSDIGDDGRVPAGLRARLPASTEIVRKTCFPDDFAEAALALGII
ncbi:MAG TPA: Hpt domain-containing protein [Azospirillaceae bacterium]|nr:Hpt domain-containing protein [Azospirillaceae bacterium]